jgi:alkylation response protein AidB-like acyl-CoA dehydrogenase
MGGVGFTRELGIEKYWRYVNDSFSANIARDSKIGAIYEGKNLEAPLN